MSLVSVCDAMPQGRWRRRKCRRLTVASDVATGGVGMTEVKVAIGVLLGATVVAGADGAAAPPPPPPPLSTTMPTPARAPRMLFAVRNWSTLRV